MPDQPDDPIHYEMKIPPEPKRGPDPQANDEPEGSRENEEPAQQGKRDKQPVSSEGDSPTRSNTNNSAPDSEDFTK